MNTGDDPISRMCRSLTAFSVCGLIAYPRDISMHLTQYRDVGVGRHLPHPWGCEHTGVISPLNISQGATDMSCWLGQSKYRRFEVRFSDHHCFCSQNQLGRISHV
jgi:hypothetical protein